VTTTETAPVTLTFSPGSLVTARGREWVVLPDSDAEFLVLRPLGGGEDDTAGIFLALEDVRPATFPPPTVADLGDASSAGLLRTALRIGFRSSAGPFRSLANLAVEPRAYQFVPLLLALRQETVRLLISDDVGIGKTIESALIAAELLAQGSARRLAVLCSPALAEQWRSELREKFAIDAELVLSSTAHRLSRGLMMNESVFDKYPFVVVSTDFIKSPQRRQEFVNHCPELVIVDEAHTAVADGGSMNNGRTQRYELMQRIAADHKRHLILVTATPHSGKEEGFRNLIGLLDPELATVDLGHAHGRNLLARHYVQRRRADIRRYLDEETAFPKDREFRDAPYKLHNRYAEVFDLVLAYAREQVLTGDRTSPVTQRVRWWSALALLRALSSSPRAAAATLRTRAASLGAATVEEADTLGRASVLDTDDEFVDSLDSTPGADAIGDDSNPDDPDAPRSAHQQRLLDLATAAEALEGPKADRKVTTLIDELKTLLADGYDPIVFCRFIHTADYLGDHLAGALGKGVVVGVVTGTLPPSERLAHIEQLTAAEGRHVLVATDCLSEGVNLQANFQAVVHYDLAWNPTRHEQREGRVDRFGQPFDVVRAVTIYGQDNQIDGIVLDVLLRKHRAIRKDTGVSVPVPDQSDSVIEALIDGLVLRGRQGAEQLHLDLDADRFTTDLHRSWESAAEREKRSQTKYEQAGIHPEQVAREVDAARTALGSHTEMDRFCRDALAGLGASLSPTPDGFTAVTTTLPIGLRDALPLAHREPLPFHHDLPIPRAEALIARTDPHVEAIARFVLDTALDPLAAGARRAASRCGVVRTRAVKSRTTVLVVRFRFHLTLPGRDGPRPMVTEEARFLAFTGSADKPHWLTDDAVDALLALKPDANMAPDQAGAQIEQALARVTGLEPALDHEADRLASELLDAHHRVRSGAGAPRRGLSVKAQQPADVLGLYLYLPIPAGGAA
jgi:superfamily II DNA or RNA helicase